MREGVWRDRDGIRGMGEGRERCNEWVREGVGEGPCTREGGGMVGGGGREWSQRWCGREYGGRERVGTGGNGKGQGGRECVGEGPWMGEGAAMVSRGVVTVGGGGREAGGTVGEGGTELAEGAVGEGERE